MKIPVRLENAVTKLYNAFHKGELEAMDCTRCAVGNMCDNKEEWDSFGLGFSGYTNPLQQKDGLIQIKNTGYSISEIFQIERLFILPLLKNNELETKETQFKGLCAVVEYLCELDNVPNVMDIKSLFEYENDKHKYELNEIL